MVGQPFATELWAPSLISPLEGILAVTPSDTTDLQINGADGACRAIMFGVAGDIEVVDLAGNTTVIVGLAAGVWHAMRIRRVRAAGTAATSIYIGY